jgi:hypothetical protein
VLDWLVPFFKGWGLEAQNAYGEPTRDFLKEVERNLRIQLSWQYGRATALEDLWRRIQKDPDLLLNVLRFACEHVLLGYEYQNYQSAGRQLDRALREAGAVWEVVELSGRTTFQLRRRVASATTAAVTRTTSTSGGASDHLERAWQHAFGRDPDPSRAYAEAIKAVEAVAIPIVVPNDPLPTLGKVIGHMRSTPTKWQIVFTEPVRLSGQGQTAPTILPIDVLIGGLDLLWKNQKDRHAQGDPHPAVPITQPQAETAVHLALLLVHVFRSGTVRAAP